MADSAQQPDGGAEQHEKSASQSLIELVAIVGIAIGLALSIQAFLVKPYRIPSASMEPTLTIGQRILVNRLEGRYGTPERGDILVFDPPSGDGEPACGVKTGETYAPGQIYRDGEDDYSRVKMPCPIPGPGKFDEAYVKRVVGLPGESIAVKRGRVFINGKQIPERYLPGDDDCRDDDDIETDCNFPTPITIPAGHYFMMGDNRNDGGSFDSRFWGPVDGSSVIGKVFFTYWPAKKIGTP
ncbi:MAG: signal peptidase I [Solirubrobacterales bacterium]